jgi:hypothetical protein
MIIDSVNKTICLGKQLLFGNGQNNLTTLKYQIQDGILKIDVQKLEPNKVRTLLKEINENIHLFKSEVKEVKILND